MPAMQHAKHVNKYVYISGLVGRVDNRADCISGRIIANCNQQRDSLKCVLVHFLALILLLRELGHIASHSSNYHSKRKIFRKKQILQALSIFKYSVTPSIANTCSFREIGEIVRQ